MDPLPELEYRTSHSTNLRPRVRRAVAKRRRKVDGDKDSPIRRFAAIARKHIHAVTRLAASKRTLIP